MGTHPIFESDFDCLTECITMTDWADDTLEAPVQTTEIDEKVPESVEIDKGDQRVKISYKYRTNEQTNKRELVKTTRTFDLVKTRTSKKVAMRKNWAKFGLSKNDSKGPQDSTTIIAEEVTMRFIHADQTEEDAEEEDEIMMKVKRQVEYISFFNGFKPKLSSGGGDTMRPENQMPDAGGATLRELSARDSKYVAPRTRGGPSMGRFQSDEVPAIRVSNISSAATQDDLQQLFEKFGRINRIHLGRDRRTNESRGFAFINYQSRDDAQRAIDAMNGFGYDHLILSVEWSENRKKDTDSTEKPAGYQSRVRRN